VVSPSTVTVTGLAYSTTIVSSPDGLASRSTLTLSASRSSMSRLSSTSSTLEAKVRTFSVSPSTVSSTVVLMAAYAAAPPVMINRTKTFRATIHGALRKPPSRAVDSPEPERVRRLRIRPARARHPEALGAWWSWG
jgi:hypothetical protein